MKYETLHRQSNERLILLTLMLLWSFACIYIFKTPYAPWAAIDFTIITLLILITLVLMAFIRINEIRVNEKAVEFGQRNAFYGSFKPAQQLNRTDFVTISIRKNMANFYVIEAIDVNKNSIYIDKYSRQDPVEKKALWIERKIKVWWGDDFISKNGLSL